MEETWNANFAYLRESLSRPAGNDNDTEDEWNYDHLNLPPSNDEDMIQYDGRTFYRKYLKDAITAKDRKKRLNNVMRALWSPEALVKMYLSEKMQGKNNHIMTEDEIKSVVNVVKKIDGKHPCRKPDLKKIEDHHNYWISEFLKENRRRSGVNPTKMKSYLNRKKNERERRRKSSAKEKPKSTEKLRTAKKHNRKSKKSNEESNSDSERIDDDQLGSDSVDDQLGDVSNVCTDAKIIEEMKCALKDILVTSMYGGPNDNGQSGSGVSHEEFATVYQLSEEAMTKIFTPDVVIVDDKKKYRTVEYVYETLMLVKSLLAMSTNQLLKPASILFDSNKLVDNCVIWDFEPSIIKYLVKKYTVDHNLSNGLVGLRESFITTSITYGVMMITQMRTESSWMFINETMYECSTIVPCDKITMEQWRAAIEKHGVVDENNNRIKFLEEKNKKKICSISLSCLEWMKFLIN